MNPILNLVTILLNTFDKDCYRNGSVQYKDASIFVNDKIALNKVSVSRAAEIVCAAYLRVRRLNNVVVSKLDKKCI